MKTFLLSVILLGSSIVNAQEVVINKGYCFNNLNFQTDMSLVSGEWEIAEFPEEGFSAYSLIDSEEYYCSELFGVLFDNFTVYNYDSDHTNSFRFTKVVDEFSQVDDFALMKYLKSQMERVLGEEAVVEGENPALEQITKDIDYFWVKKGVVYNLSHGFLEEQPVIHVLIYLEDSEG